MQQHSRGPLQADWASTLFVPGGSCLSVLGVWCRYSQRYSKEPLPADWAATLSNPGVWCRYSQRYSKEPLPADWAATLCNPGVWCRYSQRYSKEPLPADWAATLCNPGVDARLTVPGVNPFTPTNLTMLAAEEHPNSADDDVPLRVVDDAFVRMLCAPASAFAAQGALSLRVVDDAFVVRPCPCLCVCCPGAFASACCRRCLRGHVVRPSPCLCVGLRAHVVRPCRCLCVGLRSHVVRPCRCLCVPAAEAVCLCVGFPTCFRLLWDIDDAIEFTCCALPAFEFACRALAPRPPSPAGSSLFAALSFPGHKLSQSNMPETEVLPRKLRCLCTYKGPQRQKSCPASFDACAPTKGPKPPCAKTWHVFTPVQGPGLSLVPRLLLCSYKTHLTCLQHSGCCCAATRRTCSSRAPRPRWTCASCCLPPRRA